MSEARTVLIAKRLNDRLWRICEVVPPIEPGPQFWLESDSGPSYCWPCAVKARAEEFGLGVPLWDSNRWRCKTDLEEAFYEGIDGGLYLHGDNTVACDTCGKTLSYILTDEGVDEEIHYWLENPLIEVRDEDSYALDRLALNVWDGAKRSQILGVSAAVNQAWRLLAGRV